MYKILLALAFIGNLLIGCTIASINRTSDGGDTIALRYAQQLSLIQYKGYVQATLANPWKEDAVLHSYVLVPKGRVGDSLLQHDAQLQAMEATVVRTPIAHAVVFTTSHCSLLYDLHAQQALSGVCDLAYINLPDVQRRAKLRPKDTAAVVDCGSSMQPDVERIMQLHPEVLLVSPFEQSGGFGKLATLNIPIIETADYMETSALGRAEWMKFYGLLFGRALQANALFAQVDSNYHALMAKAQQTREKVSAFTERKMGSVWYVPGGRSTIAQLLRDARVTYPFADDTHSGSLALSFETVLNEAGNSDIWLIKYNHHPNTRQALLAEEAGYAQFKAFQRGKVFGCDCAAVPYYEEVDFHPDRLLNDILQIAHPTLNGLAPLRYYHRIK
ncbi:MAG: ABC transporter substrate-binding protein [Prevotella sp.]|nr:ABC transporter substrate-binding protein [Prevotella sp.]